MRFLTIARGVVRSQWRASPISATHVRIYLSASSITASGGSNTSTLSDKTKKPSLEQQNISKGEKVVKESCGDLNEDHDDEMEQEEMFVEAHSTFKYPKMEWGGPRRGGRLPEPTRYGDWERKGRCTDF
jgi:hypothetical protein